MKEVLGLAEETGAGLVVSGAYYLLGADIRFQAQLTDAVSNAVVYSAPAVTGPRDSPGDVIEALRAGAWDYMLKPLNAGRLQRALRQIKGELDERRAASRGQARLMPDGRAVVVPRSGT